MYIEAKFAASMYHY